MLSVTTGFALAALGLPENFEHYLNLVKALEIPPFIIFSGKTALAWPLCYHSFNGIRHLVCITNQNSRLHGQPPGQEGWWKLTQQYLLCFVCLFGFIFQAWDLGFGFDMNILYKTGWFVFIGSMGAAAALAYFLWIKLEFCDLKKYRETEEF